MIKRVKLVTCALKSAHIIFTNHALYKKKSLSRNERKSTVLMLTGIHLLKKHSNFQGEEIKNRLLIKQ